MGEKSSVELVLFVTFQSFQGIAKQLLFPVIPQFTHAFVEALVVPDGPSSDSGLKMEILKVTGKKMLFHYRH